MRHSSHNYAYSFEPNPEWPNYYATSGQILDYMKKVTEKYNVGNYVKFGHEIQHALLDEEKAKWKLRAKHGQESFDDECDISINVGGF
jgi:cation diffusion facilitator CzcD-associated flavoprotein CzcO